MIGRDTRLKVGEICLFTRGVDANDPSAPVADEQVPPRIESYTAGDSEIIRDDIEPLEVGVAIDNAVVPAVYVKLPVGAERQPGRVHDLARERRLLSIAAHTNKRLGDLLPPAAADGRDEAAVRGHHRIRHRMKPRSQVERNSEWEQR